MDNIKIDKILKYIQYKIDSIECTYNIEPNKIIIGSEVFYLLECYFLYELQYSSPSNECKLYGIPVIIDYNNPWNVEVCICFKVEC